MIFNYFIFVICDVNRGHMLMLTLISLFRFCLAAGTFLHFTWPLFCFSFGIFCFTSFLFLGSNFDSLHVLFEHCLIFCKVMLCFAVITFIIYTVIILYLILFLSSLCFVELQLFNYMFCYISFQMFSFTNMSWFSSIYEKLEKQSL